MPFFNSVTFSALNKSENCMVISGPFFHVACVRFFSSSPHSSTKSSLPPRSHPIIASSGLHTRLFIYVTSATQKTWCWYLCKRELEERVGGRVSDLLCISEDDTTVQQIVVQTSRRGIPQEPPRHNLRNVNVKIQLAKNFLLVQYQREFGIPIVVRKPNE